MGGPAAGTATRVARPSAEERLVGDDRAHREVDECSGVAVAEEVRMRIGRAAEDVQRHAGVFARGLHAMKALVRRAQVRDRARR